jgi:hypothetical protein
MERMESKARKLLKLLIDKALKRVAQNTVATAQKLGNKAQEPDFIA